MARDRIERRRAFWKIVEAGLESYTKHRSLHLWLGFGSREGAYLITALVALSALTLLATRDLFASSPVWRGASPSEPFFILSIPSW